MAYVGRPHFSLVGIDPALDSITSLTTAADKMIYTTGADTYAVTPITAFGRSILDDADATTVLSTLGVSTYAKTILDDADDAAARTTLGLGTMATAATTSYAALAGATFTGAVTYDAALYEKTVAAVLSNGDATATLDASAGNNFTLAVGGANITSVVFSNLPASKTFFFSIKITQHASTPRTITWPAPFKWATNTAMSLSTTAGKVDVAVGFTADQGSTIYIFEAGKDLS